jgi:IMP dehydrogenase
VPVVDEGKPVGVVTDRDVALAVPDYPNDLADHPVSDIMSRDVVAVRPDDSLAVVKEKFGDKKVRRILVIDSDGQLVGIISWADLAPYLSEADLGEVVAEVIEDAPETHGKKGAG